MAYVDLKLQAPETQLSAHKVLHLGQINATLGQGITRLLCIYTCVWQNNFLFGDLVNAWKTFSSSYLYTWWLVNIGSDNGAMPDEVMNEPK